MCVPLMKIQNQHNIGIAFDIDRVLEIAKNLCLIPIVRMIVQKQLKQNGCKPMLNTTYNATRNMQ